MNSYLLNIDTASRENRVVKVNNNPFQCTYIFSNMKRRLSFISLKNAQIPVCFYNVRAPYNTITINGTTRTLAPGNYTSTTVLTALNAIAGMPGVFSINTVTNKMIYTPTTGPTTITPSTTGTPDLCFMLGFTAQMSSGTTPITATNCFSMLFDMYIRVHIENLNIASTDTALCTFKIPVNVIQGGMIFWNENAHNTQEATVASTTGNVDRLNIRVIDRFGNMIDNNGEDWTFTIEIKSDT